MIKHSPKFLVSFLVVLIYRLINVGQFIPLAGSPLTAFLLPMSRFGKLVTFTFGFLSICIFDVLYVGIFSGTFDIWWTLLNASTYGAVGMLGYLFYKKFHITANKYTTNAVKYLFIGIACMTVYDVITGVVFPVVFSNASFAEKAWLQIAFSLGRLPLSLTFGVDVTTIPGSTPMIGSLIWNTLFLFGCSIVDMFIVNNKFFTLAKRKSANTKPPLPRPERDGGGNVLWM